MWNTLKQATSNAINPNKWKNLDSMMRLDVILMWAFLASIIFTGLVLHFYYVRTEEESFRITSDNPRFNITRSRALTKHITIFTITDKETDTDYILYDHSDGMFDNQAILLDKIKKEKETQ